LYYKEKLWFTGMSQITFYDNKVLSSAPPDKVYMDFVEIDVNEVRNKKLNKFNDIITDRRKKFYLN